MRPQSLDRGSYIDLPTLSEEAELHRRSSSISKFSATRPLITPIQGSFLIPPQPGYARADIMPGNMIRLSIVPSRPVTWAPGQYILVRIPEISKFTSHPFTISSICDQAPSTRSAIVVLIAAKDGFTSDLWRKVNDKVKKSGGDAAARSAVLRTHVDGPFGSASRSRWAKFSTVIIIVGGSGISFGLAVMQFLTLCMNGREPGSLSYNPGGFAHTEFLVRRIRFVWTISEFANIQWGASVIKRCMEMAPAGSLQVNIVVSFSRNKKHESSSSSTETSISSASTTSLPLNPSTTSLPLSEASIPTDPFNTEAEMAAPGMPLPPITSKPNDNDMYHPLDFTNFDGEDQSRTLADDRLSSQIQSYGTVKRKATADLRRRQTAKLAAQSTRSPFADPDPAMESHILTSPGLTSSPPPSSFPLLAEEPKEIQEFSPLSPPPEEIPPLARTAVHIAEASETTLVGKDDEGPAVKFSEDKLHLSDMDPEEASALRILSEHSRHGSLRDLSKIERILKEEKSKSHGAIAVACCGPLALTAAIRKAVASQIDPGAISKGDMTGSITLMSEEFDY